MFGGFILHFLLSNFLTVLLKPSYEKPVESAADLINRGITPFYYGEIWRQFFAASPDPNYQEISRRIVIAKTYDEYEDMVHKTQSTGLFATFGVVPSTWYVPLEEHKNWYRSSEKISGQFPYNIHLSNKKWPLKKVQ